MMQHSSILAAAPLDEAGDHIARLCNALTLVEQIAGRPASAGIEEILDISARIGSAYAQATPIVQRRFDALIRETATWAANGIAALLEPQEGAAAPHAAAGALADALNQALGDLGTVLDF
jgi:hypothetical protein